MSSSHSYSRQSSGNIQEDGTITAAGKGQVCIPTAEKNAQFRKLKAIRDNQTCFDCPNTRPTWASVTHGMSFFRNLCVLITCCVCIAVLLLVNIENAPSQTRATATP
jgi:hypothetical protein